MIEVSKKYFGYVGRFEKMNTYENHFDIHFGGSVKGLHIFIMKLYISIYIRFGKLNKNGKF